VLSVPYRAAMRLHGLAAIGTFLRESRTGTAQPFGCRYLFADLSVPKT